MLFRARIGLNPLSRLCHRWYTGLHSGLTIRKILARDVESQQSAKLKQQLTILKKQVNQGESLQAGFEETNGYFPPLFRELVTVGEATGQLPEILRQLHEHYEHQIKLRRDFLQSISWPALQLAAAILIIGFLIWILGFIAETLAPRGTEPMDITGLGLSGTRGMIIYFTGVVLFFGTGWFVVEMVRRGVSGTYFLHRLILMTPVLGPAIRTMGLARMAWTLHLTLDTEMLLKDSIPLALGSTGNLVYVRMTDAVVESVLDGNPLSVALVQAGNFPQDFIDTLEVGEMSGRIPESMGTLSEQYQDKARRALATITMVAGFMVWGAIAVIMAAMIFRLFYVAYYKPIMDLL